jgi:hypothetical protein
MKEGSLPCGYVAGGLEKARGATPAEGKTTAKRTGAAPGGMGRERMPWVGTPRSTAVETCTAGRGKAVLEGTDGG